MKDGEYKRSPCNNTRRAAASGRFGHLHPCAASSAIGCRAPRAAVQPPLTEGVKPTLMPQRTAGAFGRVEVWRGGCRPNISVAAPFVWRCLTGSTLAPFPHLAHRTGHADLPHPALGRDVTPSPTTGPDQAVRGVRAGGARKGARVIASALASPDFVLVPEPPAQPHSRVAVERAIGFAGGADTEVIGPSAKRAVQHVDELCGLLPATRSVGQRMDSFDHALDALL